MSPAKASAAWAPYSPPDWFGKVPPAVLRRLDDRDVLRDALVAAKNPHVYGPVIALRRIDSAHAAARRQQHRILRAKKTLTTTWSPGRGKATIFDDVHFYAICWSRIAKLARFISQRTRFRRIGLVLRKHKHLLDEMIALRDHLEHFEERLPGGAKVATMAVPGDLFNMANQFVTFGGRHVDVGPENTRLLGSLVLEFHRALLVDVVEALASSDLARLRTRLQRASSDADIARTIRQVTRSMKPSRVKT
jgi:hypothetical protein